MSAARLRHLPSATPATGAWKLRVVALQRQPRVDLRSPVRFVCPQHRGTGWLSTQTRGRPQPRASANFSQGGDGQRDGSAALARSNATKARGTRSSDSEALCEFLSGLGVSEFRCRLVAERMEAEGALPDIEGQAVPVVEALRQHKLEKSALRKVVSDAPGVLCLGRRAVSSKIDFLISMGVRESALSDTLAKCPHLLQAPVYQVGCVATFLGRELRVNWRTMPFMLERFPSVFLHPPSHDLEKLVHWLDNGMLKLGRDGTCSVVRLWPQILTFSTERIQAQCSGLVACGLKAETLRGMISASPDILSLDLDLDVITTITFLKESGLSDEQVSSLLEAEPRILKLNFSYPSEKRKIRFLREVMGRDVPDLLECPAYVLMRFDKVAARAAFLQEQGRNMREVPLRDMIHNTDRDWAREVAQVPVNQYNRFKDEFMHWERREEDFWHSESGYFFNSSMP